MAKIAELEAALAALQAVKDELDKAKQELVSYVALRMYDVCFHFVTGTIFTCVGSSKGTRERGPQETTGRGSSHQVSPRQATGRRCGHQGCIGQADCRSSGGEGCT